MRGLDSPMPLAVVNTCISGGLRGSAGGRRFIAQSISLAWVE